jgi:hypothetical protein
MRLLAIALALWATQAEAFQLVCIYGGETISALPDGKRQTFHSEGHSLVVDVNLTTNAFMFGDNYSGGITSISETRIVASDTKVDSLGTTRTDTWTLNRVTGDLLWSLEFTEFGTNDRSTIFSRYLCELAKPKF